MSDILSEVLGPPPKQVKFRCAFHNTIYDVLLARGWLEAESDWDIFWCEKDWIRDVFDRTHLAANQRVNHFRNHFELTRKDNLAKHLRRARKAAERTNDDIQLAALSIVPETFHLPHELSLFTQYYRSLWVSGERPVWIMKPVGSSQGRGIFLVDRMSQITEWKDCEQTVPYIVQRYISSPLLISGRKFDLRVYALVTSYSPLCVWIYRTGFARFTNRIYSLSDLSDHAAHLTNVAVQKKTDGYDKLSGGKWDLRRLKQYLKGRTKPAETFGTSCPVDCLFKAVEDLMLITLKTVSAVIIRDKHCFELYGFDVLIDSEMKPWLLEVNASPSLSANTEEDYRVKVGLLDDTLTVLDLEGRGVVKAAEEFSGGKRPVRVGGFDRADWVGKQIPGRVSLLGALNDRREQLLQLANFMRGS